MKINEGQMTRLIAYLEGIEMQAVRIDRAQGILCERMDAKHEKKAREHGKRGK